MRFKRTRKPQNPHRHQGFLKNEKPRSTFTENIGQISISLMSAALVILFSIFVEQYKIYEQSKRDRIQKAHELITNMISFTEDHRSNLIAMVKHLSDKDPEQEKNLVGQVIHDMPRIRGEFIAMHARVASVLGLQVANTVIDLDPKKHTVDFSDKVSCSSEQRAKMDEDKSLYTFYYTAACSVAQAAGVNMFDLILKEPPKDIPDPNYKEKNMNLVSSDIERFEAMSNGLEYQILDYLDKANR